MALDNLKILRLEAENVKKIRVVEITPRGDVIEIAGRNGQGKTSVLDSILWAIKGKRAVQWMPIREGEEEARIELDLGDQAGRLELKIVRTFRAREDGTYSTSLKVTNADGFKPDKPEGLLDALVGALSFDPGAFIRQDVDKQVATLKGVIQSMDPEADFDSIESQRKTAYDDRTEANRDLRAAKAKLDGLPEVEDAPAEAASMAGLLDELDRVRLSVKAAEAHDSKIVALRSSSASNDRIAADCDCNAETLEKRAAELRGDAMEHRNLASLDLREANELEAHPPERDGDEAEVRSRMQAVEATNALFARAQARVTALGEVEECEAAVAGLAVAIDEADAQLRALVEKADLPVNGLTLGPDCVMLRGVPFNQASDAEQLRASMALAMAANPRLRVIRIRDGSLFDSDAMAVIAEVAREDGFQIWLERVGAGAGVGDVVIMEDGSIEGAADEKAPAKGRAKK